MPTATMYGDMSPCGLTFGYNDEQGYWIDVGRQCYLLLTPSNANLIRYCWWRAYSVVCEVKLYHPPLVQGFAKAGDGKIRWYWRDKTGLVIDGKLPAATDMTWVFDVGWEVGSLIYMVKRKGAIGCYEELLEAWAGLGDLPERR